MNSIVNNGISRKSIGISSVCEHVCVSLFTIECGDLEFSPVIYIIYNPNNHECERTQLCVCVCVSVVWMSMKWTK